MGKIGATDKKYAVAVVGATGMVGEMLLTLLEERNFPVSNLYPLASTRSTGKQVFWGKKKYDVLDLEAFDFSQAEIAFFSAGGAVSEQYVPQAAQSNCIVIDNTSCFRYQEDVPLVVPEVNPEALKSYKKRSIIANPNCSTIQMLVALKPIHDLLTIKSIDVSTYQSVSGAGKSGVEELSGQTGKLLSGLTVEHNTFPLQIAFNAIPHIDVFQENGYTKEEMKMVWETHKMLDNTIEVHPTCVRIGAFYGHAEAVHVTTEKLVNLAQVYDCLAQAPGITVLDDRVPGGYPTQVSVAQGTNTVYVSRLREGISDKKRLNMWIVADNIRKGAALNAIQIAESLIQSFL